MSILGSESAQPGEPLWSIQCCLNLKSWRKRAVCWQFLFRETDYVQCPFIGSMVNTVTVKSFNLRTRKNSHIKRIKLGFPLRFCDSKVYRNFTLFFHVWTIQQLIKNMGKCLWKGKPEVWVSIQKRMENKYFFHYQITMWI